MFGNTRSTKAPFLTRFIFGSIAAFLAWRLFLVAIAGLLIITVWLGNWYEFGKPGFYIGKGGCMGGCSSEAKRIQSHQWMIGAAQRDGVTLVDTGRDLATRSEKPIVCNPKTNPKCKAKLATSDSKIRHTVPVYSDLVSTSLEPIHKSGTLADLGKRIESADKTFVLIIRNMLIALVLLVLLYLIVRLITRLLASHREAEKTSLEGTYELRRIKV